MMCLRGMKMFLSLAILFLLLDNGLGAPTRGRYMWLKCNPNGKDANCVKQRGPLVEDISGLPAKLPASALDDVMNPDTALTELEASKDEDDVEEPIEEAQDEVYEEDPEDDEQTVVEEEAQDDVYGGEEEVEEEGKDDVYGDEEEEGQDEVEEGLEKDEEAQPKVEPVERASGEGSASGPFLSDQGSGEQWFQYSSDVVPRKEMMDQVIPPVHELKEDHLLL